MFIQKVLAINQLEKIQAQWNATCASFGIPILATQQQWDILAQQYSEPQRFYHNLSHLASLLELADLYQSDLQDIELVKMAIFWHDIVYTIGNKNNELDSANLAIEWLSSYEENKTRLEQLHTWILYTAGHTQDHDVESDAAFFLDFDIAILGASRECYAQYAQAIESEFTTLYDKNIYRMGRQHFLVTFLQKSRLYIVPKLQNEWESAARANLQWEIEFLN